MSDSSTTSDSLNEPSDTALMAQLAAGSHEAIVPLLVRYGSRVQSLAATAVDRAAAEEVVQEVFVAVWRSAASFDPAKGNFGDWLLRIARNRIANELRRRGRRPETHTAADESAWIAPDSNLEPSEAVWHNFRKKTLQAAVDALPQKQRQALSLAYFDELTHQQVAAVLDVPLGTAKTRIRSALETLRQRLAPITASLLLLLILLTGFGWYVHNEGVQLDRQQRALWLVTSSDVTPVRLEPAAGIDPKTHGSYRGRNGEALAVFTFSNFAAAPTGETYQLWVRSESGWLNLGVVSLDAAGNGRLVAENPALAKPPQELRVTLESNRASTAKQPSAKTIIAWPAQN